MKVIRVAILSWSLSASIFSSPVEKVDFACPHQCGQWGSESIQATEWKFVQCLYEADKFQTFINDNYPEELQFFPRPLNFDSEWYKKMLVTYPYIRLLIKNGYEDDTHWVVYWKIEHITKKNGVHVGKIFKRNRFNDCHPCDDDDDLMEEEEQEREEDCVGWYCNDDAIVTEYSFKNRIDFRNACLQIEQDLWEHFHDEGFKSSTEGPTNTELRSRLNTQFADLSTQIQEVLKGYDHIFEECSRLHNAPSAYYELALKQFERGNYVEAIEELKSLLDKVKLESLEPNLASNIYSSKGSAEIETLEYDDAILSLSQAINLNPSNPDAYFDRAIAYFESGQPELSLQDYLNQGKDILFKPYQDEPYFKEFSAGFAKGGLNGIQEATTEFLPSIYNSISGVGNFLWLTIQHPIDTPKQLVGSTIEFCNYLRTCDKAELAEMLVPEMYELVVDWDKLTHERRGELLGYSLGKYGLDILLPVASVKGLKYVKTFHDIKRAERLGTLQTLAKSTESREGLIQRAVKWRSTRKACLAKAQLEIDKHTKHVPGAWNYEEGKGIMTHPDPQKLLTKHAGRGQKIKGIPGQPDYRERVDFGEIIGYYVDEDTKVKTLTTNGTIRYSKKGAHIVPATPNE
jgi:tetratricopeptide (TPR) repeat protein